MVSGKISRPGKLKCFCCLFSSKGEAGRITAMAVICRVIKLDSAARAIGGDNKGSCVSDSHICATSYSCDRSWVDCHCHRLDTEGGWRSGGCIGQSGSRCIDISLHDCRLGRVRICLIGIGGRCSIRFTLSVGGASCIDGGAGRESIRGSSIVGL